MSCPLCRAGLRQAPFRAASMQFRHCADCGLRYLERFEHVPPRSIYDASYLDRWGEASDLAAVRRLRVEMVNRLLREIPRPPSPGARWLDLGCGLAFSLLVAAERGWVPVGLDLNITVLKPGQRPVVCGSLSEIPFRNESFDLIGTFDVIEHVPDSVAFLREVRRVLRKGGRALIFTPDIRSASARVWGAGWPHFNREHLIYLDPSTLRRSAEAAGLRLVRARPSYRTLSLEYMSSVSHSRHTPVLPALTRMLARLAPRPIRQAPFPIPTGDFVAVVVRE